MIADIVEMILVDHICNFVKLNSGFLRVNSGLPADEYHDDTFVSGVDDEYGGKGNAAGCSEEIVNRLKMKLIQLIKLMRRVPHTRGFPFENLLHNAAIEEVELSCDGHETVSHCDQHLKAEHSVDLLCNLAYFIVRPTQIN